MSAKVFRKMLSEELGKRISTVFKAFEFVVNKQTQMQMQMQWNFLWA